MPARRISLDYVAAGAVIALGLFMAGVGLTYPQGSLLRPGPGFFPLYIGLLLAILGGAVILETLVAARRPAPEATDEEEAEAAGEAFSLRPILFISVGILVFALMLERVGLVPATVAVILLSSLGERRSNWFVVVGVCIVMSLLGVALFIWGLKVPISAFGGS